LPVSEVQCESLQSKIRPPCSATRCEIICTELHTKRYGSAPPNPRRSSANHEYMRMMTDDLWRRSPSSLVAIDMLINEGAKRHSFRRRLWCKSCLTSLCLRHSQYLRNSALDKLYTASCYRHMSTTLNGVFCHMARRLYTRFSGRCTHV